MAYGLKYGFNWGIGYDTARSQPVPPPPVYPVYIQPDTGWAGDVVTALTPGLYDKLRDDHFNKSVLNSTLWSSSVVGNGAVTETTSLLLSAGPAANSKANITSQQPFGAADATVSFIVIPTRAGIPTSPIDYLCMEAFATANSYIRVYRSYDLIYGHVYTCDIKLNGVSIPSRSIGSCSTKGEIRIIWAGASMTVLARDIGQRWQVLAYTRTWTATFDAYISIFTSNNEDANSIASSRVRSFICPPGILFDAEPAIDVTPSVNDIQLIVPERRDYSKAKIPVTVFTYNGVLGTRQNAFEYVRPDVRHLSHDALRSVSTSLNQDRLDIYAEVFGVYGSRLSRTEIPNTGNTGGTGGTGATGDTGVGTPPVVPLIQPIITAPQGSIIPGVSLSISISNLDTRITGVATASQGVVLSSFVNGGNGTGSVLATFQSSGTIALSITVIGGSSSTLSNTVQILVLVPSPVGLLVDLPFEGVPWSNAVVPLTSLSEMVGYATSGAVPTTAAGVTGNSIIFSGRNYVSGAYSADLANALTNDITVEFDAKLVNGFSYFWRLLYFSSQSWIVQRDGPAANNVYMTWDTATGSYGFMGPYWPDVFTYNQWTHIVIVRKRSSRKMSMYSNGIVKWGTTVSVDNLWKTTTADGVLRIGQLSTGDTQGLIGQIDNLRIWGSVLPQYPA